ncbi:MAG: pentapeptide repeat-containing protein [Alphaproteobacteria bacterium]|nr:pentapeptide repeat-containing protein [Alphaproteobacteria bacterium]MDE2264522.1 pentapeptide repeat-containing protein [Alphaproteobacteria bacterium]
MTVISQPESKLNRSWAGWAGHRLTQDELNAVTAAHARFIRHMPQGARAQLGSANILGLDLSRRLLKEADFSGADLTGSYLTGANLEGANLFSATLCGCDLGSANLRKADLRGVSLRGANLSFSVLDGADLRAAFMFKVGGDGGYARNLSTTKDNVGGGVDFSNCSMKGTSMNEVNLKGASFRNALLQGVSFKRAKLSDVVLDGAILTQMNPEELPFSAEALKTCLLDPSADAIKRAPEVTERLRLHELWYASNGKEGAPAELDGEDFRPLGKIFCGRKITAFVARNAIAAGIDFTNCQLQGAHFDGSDLRDADFSGADLRGASFRGAKLAHARFKGADLKPLKLEDGEMKAVDLSDAEYSAAQFADTALAAGPA